jgi:N utilization substance protein A
VKVVLDEEAERIEVVVPDTQLSLAIGRRGQNVRLASQLTGWDIDILTEAEESERRQAEFAERSQMFMETLDVDEVIAQLLASEGFSMVEETAYVEIAEIANIEGFDEETALEIQTRAREYLERREKELDTKRKELGVEDEVLEIPGMTPEILVALGENEIKTVEDFAGYTSDDLVGWHEKVDGESVRQPGFLDNFKVSRPDAEAMIIAARIKVGWITEENTEDEAEAEAENGDVEASDDNADIPAEPAKAAPAAEEAEKTADA